MIKLEDLRVGMILKDPRKEVELYVYILSLDLIDGKGTEIGKKFVSALFKLKTKHVDLPYKEGVDYLEHILKCDIYTHSMEETPSISQNKEEVNEEFSNKE